MKVFSSKKWMKSIINAYDEKLSDECIEELLSCLTPDQWVWKCEGKAKDKCWYSINDAWCEEIENEQ